MFRLTMKRFAKNPVVLLSFLLILAWIIMVMYLDKVIELASDVDYILHSMFNLIPSVFFLFLVMSYEMFYQVKKVSLEEVVYTEPKGKRKELGTVFAVLLSASVLVSMLVYFACIRYYAEKTIFNQALWKFTLWIVVLYLFLPVLLAVFLGLLSSCCRKRVTGICSVLALFFLFDRVFIQSGLSLVETDLSKSRVVTIFSVFFHLVTAAMDGCYFVTAEKLHLYRIGFWIFLIVTILCLRSVHAKRKALIPLALAVFCLCLFFQPSGAYYTLSTQNIYNSWMHDQIYYSEFINHYETEFQDYLKELNRKVDFQVSRYRLGIDITDVLAVNAEMVLNNKDLEEYRFTLYHGYQVSDVADGNGRNLRFEQNGDFLSVYSDGGSIEEIVVKYSGYCMFYYATSQAVNLPGNLPYYPIPGWHQVFDEESEVFPFGVHMPILTSDYEVCVKHKGNYPLYSNLNGVKKEDGSMLFQGRTQFVSLMGAPYLKETKLDGVSVVYSAADVSAVPQQNKKEYQKLFQRLREHGYDLSKTKILTYMPPQYITCCVTDDSVYGDWTWMGDYFDLVDK